MTTAGEKMIGILGGCGPYAGVQLVATILGETNAKKDQEHLPLHLCSVPGAIIDRTQYLLDPALENPAFAIAELIAGMERVGVDVAGIACNTSHAPAIYDVIGKELERRGCRIRLLNMIDETVNLLRSCHPGASRIGILGSDGTCQTRLYESRLEAEGYTVVKPDAGFQHDIIHQCVYHPQYGIKAKFPVTDKARESLATAMNFFIAAGAEVLILGCTEFSLAANIIERCGLGVVDSTKALARALIRETHPGKLARDKAPHAAAEA